MLNKAHYETFKEIGNSGILISYETVPGDYHPLHWHEEIELLYPLNGEADINIEGKTYKLLRKQLLVVESCEIHSTHSYNALNMFLCIHLSKKHMQQYIPGIELYQIECKPEEIRDEDFPSYLGICKMLELLTRSYIEDVPAFQMEAEGIILQILARLIRHFSTNTAPQLNAGDAMTRERIRQVITYVEEHFREPVTLLDIADHVGLGKEYFCRYFKKSMGISFFSYLNEIRLSHIYNDLVHTDKPISELIEENGLTNQKLFNRSFKELYGCTPSSVRKVSTN